ncbi:hypothetical protein F4781DRAFT_431799 [Annulohypoxylon bovei var. microspora]|nr:hypothetical protein F4781DRAFT_431799 [Annulohypoxylon bovei var. microspora]
MAPVDFSSLPPKPPAVEVGRVNFADLHRGYGYFPSSSSFSSSSPSLPASASSGIYPGGPHQTPVSHYSSPASSSAVRYDQPALGSSPTIGAADRRRRLDQQRGRRMERNAVSTGSGSASGTSPPPWRKDREQRRGAAYRHPGSRVSDSPGPRHRPGSSPRAHPPPAGLRKQAGPSTPPKETCRPAASSPGPSEEVRLVLGYFHECLDDGATVLTPEEQGLLCEFLDVDDEGQRGLVRRLVARLVAEERSVALTYKLAAWIHVHDRCDRTVVELLSQRLSRPDALDDMISRETHEEVMTRKRKGTTPGAFGARLGVSSFGEEGREAFSMMTTSPGGKLSRRLRQRKEDFASQYLGLLVRTSFGSRQTSEIHVWWEAVPPTPHLSFSSPRQTRGSRLYRLDREKR